MLSQIWVPIIQNDDPLAFRSHFSDGQFQSVYIYALMEIFKDRNCITLLDEPDAFLHPEWQFDFLKQVFEITDTTTKNNHVLMSSHSASTITKADEGIINLLEFDGDKVTATKATKGDVIKSLSAGLISFSETEARLNIQHILKNTTGSVLFTEGITDEIILEIAWTKLYPDKKRKFEIQSAFGCAFLRSLMKDEEFYRNNQGRIFFSLFDFDSAYDDWRQFGEEIQSDPEICMVTKRKNYQSYALLLPVPSNPVIRKQVINPHSGETYKNRSLLTIELLFYGIPRLEDYFSVDTERTDSFIKFSSDKEKAHFARDIVPTLDKADFKNFRPIFEFIESKCSSAVVQTNAVIAPKGTRKNHA